MRILFSAFACDPHKGSEAQCGWAWAESLRDLYEVHVLTREENRSSIENYIAENHIDNVFVHYCDIPESINLYNRFGRAYHFYYVLWQRVAYKAAKKLHRDYCFDVIQHVTLGDLRIAGSLWKLDSKFVFGPVGGGQVSPIVFSSYLKEHTMEEYKRALINRVFMALPSYHRAMKKAYRIYAANPETQEVLRKVADKPEKCQILSENGVSERFLSTIDRIDRTGRETITIMWAGRLVYRKGLLFLLDVLEQIDVEKKWKMIIVGEGPQKQEIVNRVQRMEHNGHKVHLVGNVTYDQMKQYYAEADVFVFPSFRETTGTVLFEAMSNSLPIVSFNQNGASLLVDRDSGILIDIHKTDIERVKTQFADAIKSLIEDEEKRLMMGKAAHQRIMDHYIWTEKVRKIIY